MSEADDIDLHCPLCGYSLRGLVDPPCPECGFAFAWAELREAARNKHPYLFEHGAGHKLRTFWLTFWRDCLPRRGVVESKLWRADRHRGFVFTDRLSTLFWLRFLSSVQVSAADDIRESIDRGFDDDHWRAQLHSAGI